MTISTLMQLRVSFECMVCEDAHLRGVSCFCFSCTRMGEGGGVGPAHGREPQRNKKTLTILAAGRNGDPDGHAHPLDARSQLCVSFFVSVPSFFLYFSWSSAGHLQVVSGWPWVVAQPEPLLALTAPRLPNTDQDSPKTAPRQARDSPRRGLGTPKTGQGQLCADLGQQPH